MSTATLTSKGQVTIPAAIRLALGIDAGSRIEFLEIEGDVKKARHPGFAGRYEPGY